MFIQNKHCYDFQLRKYEKGILDDFVDITYILTSKDSTERNAQVEAQLVKLIPTKHIYFVYNSTYKKCKKQLPEQIPPYDLKDANLNIMQHSIDNGFNNILILENDFIYSDLLLDNTKNKEIVREICDFFNDPDYSEKAFAYNLGPIIKLVYPNLNLIPNSKHKNTFKLLLGSASQAVIYNKKIRYEICNGKKNILTKIFKDIDKNMDGYINFNYDVYLYKHPLIYQILSPTENQKHWFQNRIINYILVNKDKLINLDKTPEPGFTIIYEISFFLSYFLFFLLIFLILYFLISIFSLRETSKFRIIAKTKKK